MSDCLTFSLDDVCSYLKTHDRYVILTHKSPDGDTLGSGYALHYALDKLGKTSRVVCSDEIPTKFGYFMDTKLVENIENETIISVDVADIELLGQLKELYDGKIELAIDHHISNTRFAKRLYLDASASAVCECIFDIINHLNLPVDELMAMALYTGIATDTGCFKYSNTTTKTHLIAAELMKTGIDAAYINRIMFDTKSKSRMEIERKALKSAEFHFNDRCFLISVTNEMKKNTGCNDDDLEGLSVLSRCVEGVMVGVTLRETQNNSFKISLRTYPPYDASKICSRHGGGGHVAAAGCQISGDLEHAKAMILDSIRIALEETDAGTCSDK